MENKLKDIKALPKVVKTTKEMVRDYVVSSSIPVTGCRDGDLFKLTRNLVDEALDRENISLANPVEMYHWLFELRNELKSA